MNLAHEPRTLILFLLSLVVWAGLIQGYPVRPWMRLRLFPANSNNKGYYLRNPLPVLCFIFYKVFYILFYFIACVVYLYFCIYVILNLQ